MKYVGIKNCKCKSRAVNGDVGKIVEVQVSCLIAPDCDRHFEVLELFDQGITDVSEMMHTSYYKFNKKNKKSRRDISKKVQRFLRLYNSIKSKGYDYNKGCIVVSADGARLDGSHRAAILEHLGHTNIRVRLIKWKQCCSKTEIAEIKEHLLEQRKLYKMET